MWLDVADVKGQFLDFRPEDKAVSNSRGVDTHEGRVGLGLSTGGRRSLASISILANEARIIDAIRVLWTWKLADGWATFNHCTDGWWDVIIYTADNRNIHCVSEIRGGERATLSLWFTRDASHNEDAKLLKSLSHCSLSSLMCSIDSCFPMLASNNMYWFPPEEASRFESGFDICTARLDVLGFDILSSCEDCYLSGRDLCCNILELLKGPLYLAFGDKLLGWKFANILHALQVVLFYHWKEKDLELETGEPKGPCCSSNVIKQTLSEVEQQRINWLKVVLLKDVHLANKLIGHTSSDKRSFNNFKFSALVCEWESYTIKLRKEMAMSLPYWTRHQSIFSLVIPE
ncbi:hypothetical protein OROMI_017326 [Orobanche minor]